MVGSLIGCGLIEKEGVDFEKLVFCCTFALGYGTVGAKMLVANSVDNMKRMLSVVIVAVIAMLFVGCSTGKYLDNSQNVNLSQTQVVLSQANFRVVKHVSTLYVYKSSMKKFNANQLRESAYAALVREAELTGAQTLVNVTMEMVEREGGYFFKTFQQSVLVSGTVIEFTK